MDAFGEIVSALIKAALIAAVIAGAAFGGFVVWLCMQWTTII